MKKKCKVIIVPTENNINGYLTQGADKRLYFSNSHIENKMYRNHNLYIVSKEEIKINDYMLKASSKGWLISICKNDIKSSNFENKIIATTDNLKIGKEYGVPVSFPKTKNILLPKIPESFVKAYVKANGDIDEVSIEYSENIYFNEEDKSPNGIKPKLREDNTIIIHQAETYSKEEMIHIMKKELLKFIKDNKGCTILDIYNNFKDDFGVSIILNTVEKSENEQKIVLIHTKGYHILNKS